MRRLSTIVARLKALKDATVRTVAHVDRLSDLEDFGPNPGALRARVYIPDTLAPRSALVVVLHGCTQTAAVYDYGSGWSELADRHGFALLYPEQSHANNPAACFNWFVPDDTRRGGGEAMSIHQMILATIEANEIDPGRVFITGLSAGGAMAVAMLATYPEVFAGGAIFAGLPYGCAGSVPEALKRMRGHGLPSPAELEARVRSASHYQGPWPTLSVWHGSSDHVVNPSNAEAIVTQWRGLLGTSEAPDFVEAVDGYPRQVWHDGEGREVIEAYSITGMDHGTPLDTGPTGCGASGPFMLDVGISSTQRVAAFWGIAPPLPSQVKKPGFEAKPAMAAQPTLQTTARPEADGRDRSSSPAPGDAGDIQATIERALRAAGLMK